MSKRGNEIREKSGEFERVVRFDPGYDERYDPKLKGCGRHGVNLMFVLIGPLGAVSCCIYTNWMLPEPSPQKSMGDIGGNISYIMEKPFMNPTPADISYHRPDRTEDYQHEVKECEWLGGRTCYGDGSAINAQLVYDALRTKGLDGAFDCMKKFYDSWLVGTDK